MCNVHPYLWHEIKGYNRKDRGRECLFSENKRTEIWKKYRFCSILCLWLTMGLVYLLIYYPLFPLYLKDREALTSLAKPFEMLVEWKKILLQCKLLFDWFDFIEEKARKGWSDLTFIPQTCEDSVVKGCLKTQWVSGAKYRQVTHFEILEYGLHQCFRICQLPRNQNNTISLSLNILYYFSEN